MVVVTGGSRGIGAGVVAEYRRRGWAIVAVSRTIKPAGDPAVLTVEGDVSDPATVDRIISGALESFGRIDTLINNAGVFISKPFTDYTTDDYARAVGVNLTGFFLLTQRVIGEMLTRGGGHVRQHHHHAGRLRQLQHALRPDLTHQGRARLGHQVTGHRVRVPRHPGQRRLAGRHPDAGASRRSPTTSSLGSTRSDASVRSATSSTASSSWSHRRSSPERSCTSTAARSPVTDPKACARSEIDRKVAARLGAAHQEVAGRGRLERFWCVGDVTLQEAGLAGMAHASPARPTNGHVACFGELKDAGEPVVPADVHAGPHERHERARARGAFGRVWWPGGRAGRCRA